MRLALLTLLSLLAFAGNSLLCRLALAEATIDAFSFTTLRLAAGAAVLALLARGGGSLGGSWGSATALFLYALPFSLAYRSLPAGTGALLLFGAVQATMIGWGAREGDRPRPAQWTGLAVALGGLVVLLFPGLRAPSPGGAAAMVTAGVAWGIYSLRGRGETRALAATAGNFARAAAFALTASLAAAGTMRISSSGAALAVVSGAVTSGLGYVVWYRAVGQLGATRAAIIQLAVPVLAALGGVALLAEEVTLRLAVSGLLVLGGVAIALRSRLAAPGAAAAGTPPGSGLGYPAGSPRRPRRRQVRGGRIGMSAGEPVPAAPPVFDAHLHVVAPGFPLIPNQGFVPSPFPVAEYLRRARPLGVAGGAVVAGSFQGLGQDWLLAALTELGPTFVGVAQVPLTIADREVRALHRAGVRAVRCNLRRGAVRLDEVERLAARVADLAGWHVEVYVDGGDLLELAPMLRRLPRVVIDHLGLRRAGTAALLGLVDAGVHVKASGFGRLDFDPGPLLAEIARRRPAALLFGTDLPSTRAPRPFGEADLELVRRVLPAAAARRALWSNALELYRPAAVDSAAPLE